MSLDYFSNIQNNSKVYRVVYNKLSSESLVIDDELITKYQTLEQYIEDENTMEINNIKKEILDLYNNPPNISQWLFIFIGSVDDKSINESLRIIENDKNYTNINSDLDSYFGYDVAETWKISDKYEKIFFIDNLINPEDTVSYLYLFISSLITKFTVENSNLAEKIISNSKSILLYTNSISHKETKINNIIRQLLYEYKINTYQFNIAFLKRKLESFDIPSSIVDIIVTKYNNDIANIEAILNDETIRFFINLYLSFKPLLHNIYQKKNIVPVTTYIPYYNENNDLPDYTNKKYRVSYVDSKKILKNITDSNTLYFYSLNNFLNTISDKFELSYKHF